MLPACDRRKRLPLLLLAACTTAASAQAQTPKTPLQLSLPQPRLNFASAAPQPPTLRPAFIKPFVLALNPMYTENARAGWQTFGVATLDQLYSEETLWTRSGPFSLFSTLRQLPAQEVCMEVNGPCTLGSSWRSSVELRLHTGDIGPVLDTQWRLGFEAIPQGRTTVTRPFWNFSGKFE